ncbi:MAG TPA: alginate lyase family protein [Terracidiphilus sp.]
MKRLALSLLAVLLAPACYAGDARLQSPWDNRPVALTDAPYNCPAPPELKKTIDAEGYYIDANHSIIDPAKQKAEEEATAGPTHLGQWVGLAADAYLTKGSRAAVACAYSLLTAAAEEDAMTGVQPTGQSHYEQKWMLAGTAMAYLKIRNTGVGTPDQDKAIQKWFEKIAGRVRDYVDDQRRRPNSDAWNNHGYWSGLAVAAAGIANNNTSDFRWGISAGKTGIDEISPIGVLPREMERAGRALHYHLYALAPLVMLAELGRVNDIDLYSENHEGIKRLAQLCETGLQHPEIFQKSTGVQQVVSDKISGADIGWAVPYVKRYPDPQLSAWIAQAETTRSWQWGGLPPD